MLRADEGALNMNWPDYASPFTLVVFMLVFLFLPLKIFYYRARFWLLRILWKIFRAPFVTVQFADFWLADQLNSISFIFADLAFFICFYSTQMDWDTMSVCVHGGLNDTLHNTTVSQSAVSAIFMDDDVIHNTKDDSFIGSSKACVGLMFGLEPLLRALPPWFRLAQCLKRYHDMPERTVFPHLVNAGKYLSSLLVILTGAILREQHTEG
ncbi:Xenotropic and polytropic retrovirus receptor 1 [Cichlidogyrus casuarinus]|uniref:Xenotropic and polytropic retrovirus receptor 1 n=1 Tax=Cichlidogyrus casuarinus TaxID=1844966 RepID=A0ABD2QAF9_9PLAT